MTARRRRPKRPPAKTVARLDNVVLGGISDPQRRREAFETTVRAFVDIGQWEHHLDDALWQGPLFDPEHTRVALAPDPREKGRERAASVVSVVVMGPRMIRFGRVAVPAMTIGPVGTHDKHRKHGYGAAAMNDASRYMKEEGFLVAYLGGIPDFYWRYGYYPFMAQATVKFSRDRARKESLAGRLRRMKRSDLAAVAKIYEKATSGRTCSAARDRKVWDWLLERGSRTWLFPGPRVIVDARGRPCGHLTAGAGHGLKVREIVVRPDESACRSALGAIAREAKRREVREIELPLPWDDPLAVFIRQHVGGEFRMHTHATGGALLKIVDLPELMRRLAPEFTRRWRAARSSIPGGRFTLASDIGSVGFAISPGRVEVGEPSRSGNRVHVPQRWLSGLLSGYHTVRSIAPRKGAVIPPALVPALEILFPPGWPFVYNGDSY